MRWQHAPHNHWGRSLEQRSLERRSLEQRSLEWSVFGHESCSSPHGIMLCSDSTIHPHSSSAEDWQPGGGPATWLLPMQKSLLTPTEQPEPLLEPGECPADDSMCRNAANKPQISTTNRPLRWQHDVTAWPRETSTTTPRCRVPTKRRHLGRW